jgi:hypothetical protein
MHKNEDYFNKNKVDELGKRKKEQIKHRGNGKDILRVRAEDNKRD